MRDALEFVFSSYPRFFGTWLILLTVASLLSRIRLFDIEHHHHHPKKDKPQEPTK